MNDTRTYCSEEAMLTLMEQMQDEIEAKDRKLVEQTEVYKRELQELKRKWSDDYHMRIMAERQIERMEGSLYYSKNRVSRLEKERYEAEEKAKRKHKKFLVVLLYAITVTLLLLLEQPEFVEAIKTAGQRLWDRCVDAAGFFSRLINR